jgi:capsid protein
MFSMMFCLFLILVLCELYVAMMCANLYACMLMGAIVRTTLSVPRKGSVVTQHTTACVVCKSLT